MSLESLKSNHKYHNRSLSHLAPSFLLGLKEVAATISTISAGGSAIALFGRLESVKRLEELSDLEIGALATLTSSATLLTFKMCCRRGSNR